MAERAAFTQEKQLWLSICVWDPFSLFLKRLIQSGGNLTRPEHKKESNDSDTESSVLGGEKHPMGLL